MSGYWFDRLLERLKRRFGRYAVEGLITYVVALKAVLYLVIHQRLAYRELFTLNADKVLRGQVWRLVTYVFVPPEGNLLFVLLVLYFLYLIGEALQARWGSFRLNLYYLLGMVALTVAALIMPQVHFDSACLNLSLFLAFAAVYPDFTVYLFFVVPVKVRHLAFLVWLFIAATLLVSPLPLKAVALACASNYSLFFWPRIAAGFRRFNPKRQTRRHSAGAEPAPFHKCAVCGRTEYFDQELEFRTCSLCGREYCLEHLREHKH